MKLTRLVSTVGMSREDWLKYRRMGIGGSDAATIVGLNPYSSLYTLWADKTGRLAPKEDNEAMRLGRDLEGYIASRWSEHTGLRCRKVNAILRNPKYPWAIADPDRLVIGADAGVECKSTSVLNLRRFRQGEYPHYYYVQCVHYMAITEAERWYLPVLALGDRQQPMHYFEIKRDEAEIKALMDAERDYWERYVVADVAPSVDGSASTDATIISIFGGVTSDEEVPVKGDTLDRYMALKAQISELETQKRQVEQEIKLTLGKSEKGICERYRVSWPEVNRTSFDHKAFHVAHPGIMDFDDYYKITTSRRFSVQEIK